MSVRLFTIIDAFRIPGRGTVIVADLESVTEAFAVGDSIEIVPATGVRTSTKIKSFELFRGAPPERKPAGFVLEHELPSEGLAGAEVFKL